MREGWGRATEDGVRTYGRSLERGAYIEVEYEGEELGRVRCRVTQVVRWWHRLPLPPVVVVDTEEGASEGHHFAIGNEDAGVNLPRWGGDEGCAEEEHAEEAE